MRFVDGRLLLAPTDLATFITCRHRSGLDLAVAHGQLSRPTDEDRFAAMLRRKGEAHEVRYVESLRTRGLTVVAIEREEGPATTASLDAQTARTLAAMRGGADAIVQARLSHASLAGYADVLLRVEQPSSLGDWSYEPQDTKLAQETKGSAILQLCGYAELLAEMQGALPAHFHVVTPDPQRPVHTYRTDEYIAYYRMVKSSLEAALADGPDRLREQHYPEPVEHCEVCAWEALCERRRRDDDHLSFIAGTSRQHRQELASSGHPTLSAVAAMPLPIAFTPRRGARETYGRIGDQARVQHRQRTEARPVVERLAVLQGEGLCRLPAPSAGDVFLDLEGARFAREGGREFLFGLETSTGYWAWWATDDASEKAAFEDVVDVILKAWRADAGMHVYHFNHYEPTAFKKLVGRHVTRAEALDELLRAERFVDLYPIVRQSVRCGVESYSLKQLEQYYGFERRVGLRRVSQPLLAVELALEAQTPELISGDILGAVQRYNEDDCGSTAALRGWLEGLRREVVAEGAEVPRPELKVGDASGAISDLQQQVEALRERLLRQAEAEEAGVAGAGAPALRTTDPALRTTEPALSTDAPAQGTPVGEDVRSAGASAPASPAPRSPLRLLAYLIDWHRREEKAEWWEYYRLKELPIEELLDESQAIAGLMFLERVRAVVGKHGRATGSVVDRYAYPAQDVEIGRKGTLHARDGKSFGDVVAHDRSRRLIEIQKGPKRAETHVSDVFACDVISTKGPQTSVMRLAERMLAGDRRTCGAALLARELPRLRSGAFARSDHEATTDFAVRVATELDCTTLAIQGPPGAGKTYAGARMIRALVAGGKRVGVTANSHKVIRNLLEEVAGQAAAAGETVRVAAKVSEGDDGSDRVRTFTANEEALAAVGSQVDVLGGTVWLWSREDAAAKVDVLVVDEAGQMSLANVLAVSPAADSLVLLGDPQQLDQPQKASHPDGIAVSALQHVLGTAETMPAERGIFLPMTYRMAPAITRFTSEVFYEGRLESHPDLARQALDGTGAYDGAGLWLMPVEHDGNQNASAEEADAVAGLIEELLPPPLVLTAPDASPGLKPRRSERRESWRSESVESSFVNRTERRGFSPGEGDESRPVGPGWIDQRGLCRPLTGSDIKVVAPFNAQVNRLAERLAPLGVEVGTVDKFQGQTAAVIIYSMATSRPEDAPRGLEFLYSLNRLNVATSRARCAAFVVCSPRLLAPECRTPRQMQLANALCRYRELAKRTG